MGVVVTHGLGDRSGRLHVSAVGAISVVVHRVEHAAVHRLESVADIRQSATDDDAHGVVDVAVLHFLLDVDRFDPVVLRDRPVATWCRS